MGQIAEDMIDGTCCNQCGCYFEKDGELYSHGYPAVCAECWEDLDELEQKHYEKAITGTL